MKAWVIYKEHAVLALQSWNMKRQDLTFLNWTGSSSFE